LENLQAAIDGLAAADDVDVVAVSSVFETDPVGGPEQPEFLNAVVAVDTSLSPHDLLAVGQRLESDADRVRAERWGPRTLDVDVLLIGDEEVHTPDLEVPHPRMWARGFVLAPLAEIAPDLVPDARDWPGVRRTDLSLRVP
jgi:2-amino-4-hydroxy-6-hydroxymethyldihydropteridine diphosphokinase